MWSWLRMTRSDPPATAAANAESRGTYTAALEQFEELMSAAAAVGPAARPLPLFYALSQAGRAIVAARGGADHTTHGLTLTRAVTSDVLHATVEPQGGRPGQFQTVAAAVGSPVVTGPVQLGALMYSLPELSSELFRADTWAKALPVFIRPWEKVGSPAHTQISLVVGWDDLSWAPVTEELRRYPAAENKIGASPIVVQSFPTLPTYATPSGLGVGVLWEGDEGDLEAEIPQYRYADRRWLRPALLGADPPPSPLMTWWVCLFGLSMLARYHPAPWTNALDIDRSHAAVELELAMERALHALPHLVLEAVLGRAIVVLPPSGPDPFEVTR
jgi:hypothetical protein